MEQIEQEFRAIPQFPQHSITECGKYIKNIHGRIIKQSPQQLNGKLTGYWYATMLAADYSYNKRVAVHRLVAFAWIPDPISPAHVWINHKNGNKANNHASNLEWTTIKQNIQHAHDTGLIKRPKGADHWRFGSKHTADTKRKQSVAKIGAKHPKFKGYVYANFKRFESCREAGKFLNVDARTIHQRCNNPKFKDKGYYIVAKTATNIELS